MTMSNRSLNVAAFLHIIPHFMWHRIDHILRADSGKISADITVPARSAWFDGHFPKDPLLPGIAQLSMARDLLCRALPLPLETAGFRRVKFKRMIRPGERLTITAEPGRGGDQYQFRIMVAGDIACSGTISVRPAAGTTGANRGRAPLETSLQG
jgi:3-hydroxyacyl-[acyl-carrier-protein] dehydratase